MITKRVLTAGGLALTLLAAPAIAEEATKQTVAETSADQPAAAPVDSDNDGKADAWDANNDGKADAWDTNADGKPDAWDSDGDGKPDKTDANGDGQPD